MGASPGNQYKESNRQNQKHCAPNDKGPSTWSLNISKAEQLHQHSELVVVCTFGTRSWYVCLVPIPSVLQGEIFQQAGGLFLNTRFLSLIGYVLKANLTILTCKVLRDVLLGRFCSRPQPYPDFVRCKLKLAV